MVEFFSRNEVTLELVAYYVHRPDLRGAVETIAEHLGRRPEEVEEALQPLVELGMARVREVPQTGMKLVEFIPAKKGDGVIWEALNEVRQKYEALFRKVLSKCFDYALADLQARLNERGTE